MSDAETGSDFASSMKSHLTLEQSRAGVVHDLGNLIQVALSGLNRVSRSSGVSTTPDLDLVISSAKTALQTAGTLVRDTIGKAQIGDRESGSADVNACLSEIAGLIRTAWEPNISLAIKSGSEIPSAKCDHLGLHNAILNLVFNAREAMPDGGSISIATSMLEQDGAPLIEIRVEDSGVGMTHETVVRAFDPFFTTKGRGLGGVGLPMVKHFVEGNGGSVAIESTFGAGTTVILRLPANSTAID